MADGKAPGMLNRSALLAGFAGFLLACVCPMHSLTLSPTVLHRAQQPTAATPLQTGQATPVAHPLLERAQAAMESKDFARAVEWLEQFLATHPDHVPARFNLAYSYAELKRYADARKNYEEVLKRDPGLHQANLNLGLILLAQQDFSSAVAPFEKVVASNPAEARGRYLLAFALEKSGKLAEAAEHYRAGSREDPKNLDFHLSLGRVAYELKDFNKAESEFRAAQALREDSAEARLGLGETLLAQNQLAAAAIEFDRYLSLKPEDGDARLRLAGLYLDLSQPEKALETLHAASADQQASPTWKETAARSYAMLKRWPEAVRLYQDLALARPNDAATFAALGEALLKARQFQAAAGVLERTLRMEPSPQVGSEARRNLVSAHYLAADYPAALAALDSLAALQPLPAILFFVRASCYDHLRQTKAAIDSYRKFLALADGNHPDQEFQARHRLIALERELRRR